MTIFHQNRKVSSPLHGVEVWGEGDVFSMGNIHDCDPITITNNDPMMMYGFCWGEILMAIGYSDYLNRHRNPDPQPPFRLPSGDPRFWGGQDKTIKTPATLHCAQK